MSSIEEGSVSTFNSPEMATCYRRDIMHPLSEEGVFIAEDEQIFSHIRQGTARNGSVVVKYTVERPAQLLDSVPLVLVPGYGGIKPAYKELRQAVVASGKTAVTFTPPRSQERFAYLRPKHMLHPERLLAQATIGIARDLIERFGEDDDFDQVDAAGHSMGGPGVINAALARPQWFRSVVLMGSAGLDGHSLRDIATRAPAVIMNEIIPSLKDVKMRKDIRAASGFFHYIARNPGRTIAEGLTVGSGDIRDKVSLVGMLGVKTVAIPFAQDRFFPLAGVSEGSAERFHSFQVFPDGEAGHMAPQLQPEAVGAFLVKAVQAANRPEAIIDFRPRS